MKKLLLLFILSFSLFSTYLSAEYIRSNDIVEDKSTGLLWQDDSAVKETKKNWDDAQTYSGSMAMQVGSPCHGAPRGKNIFPCVFWKNYAIIIL